jgi:hypothetical protein
MVTMSNTHSGSTRRTVLMGAAGAGAATAIGLGGPPLLRQASEASNQLTRATGVRMPLASLAHGSHADWLSEVGSIFTGPQGISMRLAAVQGLPSPGARPRSVTRSSAFVATFDLLAGQAAARDQIYNMTHPLFGALPIFMTVTGPGKLSAVFN